MATTTFYVPNGSEDGGYTGDTNTTIVAYARKAGILPEVNENAFANYFVSGLADNQIITGMTLHWRNSAYTQSKGVSQVYFVFGFVVGETGPVQFGGTRTFSTGWQSHTLSGGELAALAPNATNDVLIQWSVPTPTASNQFRQLNVYAYESGADKSYVVVTHEDAPVVAEQCHVMLLG